MLGPMPRNSYQNKGLWQVPRLRPEHRWLAGVADALAVEVGVEPLLIRLAFVQLTLSQGLGLALYAACWLWFTYAARLRATELAGVPEWEKFSPMPKAASPLRRWLGVGSILLGLVLLARKTLPSSLGDGELWPVAVAAFGLLLAWSSGKVDWSHPRELVRAGGGLALIAAGVIAFIVLNFARTVAPQALLVATGALSLVVVVVAPWLWRAASQVSEQRLERTRAEERAEFAAHLHDSVLQTLSLITRNAEDATITRQLARRQERELRQWLFGNALNANKGGSFRSALTELAGQVEDLHGVAIEVVVVGDAEIGDSVNAILAAAREALVNAARHSKASSIDLFGEVQSDIIEVYVRDKGVGFDPAAVAKDRQGLSASIYGRMQRAGGCATVNSRQGNGTEVTLTIPSQPGRTEAPLRPITTAPLSQGKS